MSKKKAKTYTGFGSGLPFIINTEQGVAPYTPASTDPASLARKEARDRYEEKREQERLAEEVDWL